MEISAAVLLCCEKVLAITEYCCIAEKFCKLLHTILGKEVETPMANAILPFILMAGIFYFMLWRPQKQEQKRRKEMLDSLKRGDKIITIGGMYGTLTKVGPVKVKVRLAEGVEIEFARTAISGFQDAGADAQPQPETLDA